MTTDNLEHLDYEIGMLFFAHERLKTNKFASQYEKNVFLESFIIHGSNLVEFLYDDKSKRHSDDLRYWDFIERSSVALPTKSELLKDLGGLRRNKEIAHLTKSRLTSDTRKEWPFGKIFDELWPHIQNVRSMIASKYPTTPHKALIEGLTKNKLDSCRVSACATTASFDLGHLKKSNDK